MALCAHIGAVLLVVQSDLRMHSAPLQGESKSQLSQADLVLRGHTEDAKFAVAISSAEPLVASGGDDTQVCRSLGFSGPDVRVTAVVRARWQLLISCRDACMQDRQRSRSCCHLRGVHLQVLIWDLRDHEGGSWLTMKEAEGRPPSNEPSLDAKLRLQVRLYTHAPDGCSGPDPASGAIAS